MARACNWCSRVGGTLVPVAEAGKGACYHPACVEESKEVLTRLAEICRGGA